MNSHHRIVFLFFMSLIFCVGSTANNWQTKQELQGAIDTVISECLEKVAAVKKQKVIFGFYGQFFISNPSSRKDIKLNQQIYRLAFKNNLAELERYARKTETFTVDMAPSKLSDALKAYSLNCTLFSEGIFYFVDYLKAGKPSVAELASAVVFEEWILRASIEYYRRP